MTMNANEILEQYLDMLKKYGKSELTISNYRRSIVRLFKYFKIEEIYQIQNITKQEFRNFIFSLEISNSSKNGLIMEISPFLNYLTGDEIIHHESITSTTFGNKKFLPVEKKEGNPLTEDEIKEIYSACRTSQERFMMAFMLYTGLRESSIVNVKISDINGDGLFYVKAKGNKVVPVKMNPHLMQLFEAYKADRDSSKEYLFYPTGKGGKNPQMRPIGVYERVKCILSRTSISKERQKQITAHKFRHAFVTKIYNDVSPLAAQQAAHHSNSNITKIYVDENKYSQGLEAMSKIHYELE
jgi:integrase